jgi:hypothetical protein
MSTPFKMKGSPMQRNFGIGSPIRDEKKYTEEQQQAINQGKLARWNKANPKATQDEMNAEQTRIWSASKTTPTETTE